MDGQYPSAEDYLMTYIRSNTVDNYLSLIEASKKNTSIPVIASVNCVSSGEWISFAKSVEEAGADAIELNMFYLPLNEDKRSEDYENTYFDLVTSIKKETQIPIVVKLGQNLTNIPGFIEQLYNRGAKAVVMFNRFYAPDINIQKIDFTPADVLSSPQEIRNSLRWVGIVSAVVEQIEICASTGVHSGEAVIKQLLAGANAVQVCTALYKNGVSYLEEMNKTLEDWMELNSFEHIDEFRGRLNYKHIKEPSVFERSQFMKYYSDKK